MIRDYRNLSAYTRELYQMPGIAETVDIQAYKDGYYFKNPLRNPLGIVPLGPELSFDEPPGREAL
jgi:putative glutathione S-transferase